MRIVFAAILVFMVTCSFAEKKKIIGETIISFTGDKITLSKPEERGIALPKEEVCKIIQYGDPIPLMLNGKEIFNYKDHKEDKNFDTANTEYWIKRYNLLNEKIHAIVKPELASLPEGYYDVKIDDIVINELGIIVYYKYKGIEAHSDYGPFGQMKGLIDLATDAVSRIDEKIENVIKEIQFPPFTIHDTTTPLLSYHHSSYTNKR